MTQLNFSKMHGLGNDFIVIDATTQPINLSTEKICELSDRHTGIGFDQLLLVEKAQSPAADFRYRIFNANGSEVEHCGNGARCFVRFVHDQKISDKNPLVVETMNGIITLTAQDNADVRVNMGTPSFLPADLPFLSESSENPHQLTIDSEIVEFGVVSVGNPHAVIRVDDIDLAPVEALGKALQQHPSFPKQVNVGFLQIVTRNEVRFRVYERGAGETQACGTGACAAVAYARQQDWVDESVTVHLLGGDLHIEYTTLSDDLYMTGPAVHVYNGQIIIS